PMAESRVHEFMNSGWTPQVEGGSSSMVDQRLSTIPSGMPQFEDERVKEEEIEDIEEEDPIDPDFIAQFGTGRNANNGANMNGMQMLNDILNQARSTQGGGMSSIITSTTPLDLNSLIHSSSHEESGEVTPTSLRSANMKRGRSRQDMSEDTSDVHESKRKLSNREAANRYREKKKQEMEVMKIEEEALLARNAELHMIEIELAEQIREMREMMTNTFGFAPPYEHIESPLVDFTASLICPTSEKTPKRIPFPKGLSPAEQNRESVRRDREKKKARFSQLKAEEVILSMGKDLLIGKVAELESEISEMKEKMRAVGLVVPDTNLIY
ncbi:hypothetical protein PFISCL1PPCAC_20214, partial [Pristionchus fissidentatus]